MNDPTHDPLRQLAQRYAAVRERISTAGGGRAVTLIAVSKFQPAEAIEALYRLGHRDFGENYVQELVTKAQQLSERGCTDIRWHFIGHLQTNKVKQLVSEVVAVHSVDSEKLARELAKRWKEAGRSGRLPIFLQVNIDAEDSKSGLAATEVAEHAARVAALPELAVMGLMCIPLAETPSPEVPFRRLRELEAKCRPHTLGQLSMGMTSDYELAIREGATHVRVGTALFGARPN